MNRRKLSVSLCVFIAASEHAGRTISSSSQAAVNTPSRHCRQLQGDPQAVPTACAISGPAGDAPVQDAIETPVEALAGFSRPMVSAFRRAAA
jgi:hypothetical protein